MNNAPLNPIIDAIDDFYRVRTLNQQARFGLCSKCDKRNSDTCNTCETGETMTRYENFLSKAKQARETVTMETLRKENIDLARELSSMANAFEASEIRVRWLEAENKHLRELLASKNVSK